MKVGKLIIFILALASVAQAQDAFTPKESFDIYGNSDLLNEFTTHREAEQHYYHASLFAFQLFESINEVRDDLGECETVSDFRDGARTGFTWKPESDNTRKPVMLFPPSFCGEVSKVELVGADGEFILNATPRIDGKIRECKENGNRVHYDVPVFARELEGPIIVKIFTDDGFVDCRSVENPEERQD